jgi:predicted metal-dependent enzyme (double-stranded beta helix superfamily)
MTQKDWLVDNNGQCFAYDVVMSAKEFSTKPYRLYRFLTDLEDILDSIDDDLLRLQAIIPLVRRLLKDCFWLQLSMIEPHPETGWEVLMLYDEPSFPLTIQLVAWAPGTVSPIHNHGCWGLVALLSGLEKNTFWQRTPDLSTKIETVGEQILTSGDILCLMPDTIHQIKALGNQPTISFNLYGETNFDARFEFDPIKHIAKNF